MAAMLPYPQDHEHPISMTKAMQIGLLCAVWVLTGLVGHDPWKPEDAHSFGLIYNILQSGDWLAPSISDEPYLEVPPLFYMVAAATAKLFAPWLALYDGARLASGLFTALTLLFVGLSGRELFGGGRGWAAALILMGCLGMLVTSHQMVTDLALLAGCAIMQYGYSLSHRRPARAGVLIGLGVGVGFMGKGFIAPLLFLFISAALLLFRNWRTQPFYTSLKIAALCALPWLIVWPLLLYMRSPQLFMEWAWARNIGRWLAYAGGGHYDEVLYYIKILLWFAWPALPLSAWAVWQARKKVWHEFQFQLPLTIFLVMLFTLSLAHEVKDIFALPMLLPLTLLATAALNTLRRGAANALDWFGIMTFGLIAILMWWGWAGLLLDNHAKITWWLKEYQPGFEPTLNKTTFWVALLATLLWLVLVWRVGRSMRRAIINWAAGVTLIWVLAMTLWLPWLDSGKSYRGVAVSLVRALPAQHGCVASLHVENTQLAMLQYFGNIAMRREAAAACDLLLVQGGREADPMDQETAWKKIWEGGRSSDRNERFRLYRRIGS